MSVAASKLAHSGMGVGQAMRHFLFVCCYVFLGMLGIDWSGQIIMCAIQGLFHYRAFAKTPQGEGLGMFLFFCAKKRQCAVLKFSFMQASVEVLLHCWLVVCPVCV